jgi:hypothetical protein
MQDTADHASIIDARLARQTTRQVRLDHRPRII